MDVDLHEKELKQQGYTVLKQIIPKEDILHYREVIENRRNNPDRDIGRLFLNNKTLFHLGINDPKFSELTTILDQEDLNDFLAYITDGELVYCHEFNMHIGQNNPTDWHNSCLGYIPCEHDDIYQVYRVGIFLQDHVDGGGGIALRNGSHVDKSLSSYDVPQLKIGDVIVFDARMLYKDLGYKKLEDNISKMLMMFTVGRDNEFTKLHYDAVIKRLNEKTSGQYQLDESVRLLLEANEYMYEMKDEEEIDECED